MNKEAVRHIYIYTIYHNKVKYLGDDMYITELAPNRIRHGLKEWWLNGERHREDGPAVEFDNGREEWYLNGKRLTEKEFNERSV